MQIPDIDIQKAARLTDLRRQEHILLKMSNGSVFCQIKALWKGRYDLLLVPKSDKVMVYDSNGKEIKKISIAEPVKKDKAHVKTTKSVKKAKKEIQESSNT